MSGRRKLVCLGAFAGAHGVKGDVRIRAFTETAEGIAAYGPLHTEDGRMFTFKILGVPKPGLVLARAPEIATREAAQALSGARLYVERSALPAPAGGEYYVEDIVGLAAVDEDGGALGRIAAMHNFGAGDILELERLAGGTVFVPFSDAAAPEIDIPAGRIVIARAFLQPPEPEGGG